MSHLNEEIRKRAWIEETLVEKEKNRVLRLFDMKKGYMKDAGPYSWSRGSSGERKTQVWLVEWSEKGFLVKKV